MYRQIKVHPTDRNFQLILWRKHSEQPISTFQLNTVTYGMNSSPYLAIRVLHQLADDEEEDFPDAARILRNHTYIDDIVSGADTEEEALASQDQLISLLKRGCFELRTWYSNSPKLLCNLPSKHLESPKFLQDANNTPHFTVLGLKRSPTNDVFSYDFKPTSACNLPTKRSVLSTIAQIYDPLGFLVPFIMLAKCFMQLLWTKGLSWDSPLPFDLRSQWQLFIDNIKWLSHISISTSLNLVSSSNIELHGFSPWTFLHRVMAMVLHFVNNFRNNSSQRSGYLIPMEFEEALLKKSTLLQKSTLHEEFNYFIEVRTLQGGRYVQYICNLQNTWSEHIEDMVLKQRA